MYNILKYFNRIYNKIYAGLNGYFWLPCPICNKNFGGHEMGHHGLFQSGESLGAGVWTTYSKGVCKDRFCQEVARMSEVNAIYE